MGGGGLGNRANNNRDKGMVTTTNKQRTKGW